jgi:AcrR family transcriptional regulator
MEQLRDAALDYLLQHGIADLSLRPMAQELGTSARMLMFHFKSREGLIKAMLEELHARLTTSFAKIASDDAKGRSGAPLQRFWDWASSERNLPALRLLYELQIIAIQNPAEYGRYLRKMSFDWQTAAFKALPNASRDESLATLCIAVFDGLFLELMSTGERARLQRALSRFIQLGQRDSTRTRRLEIRRPASKIEPKTSRRRT